MAPCLLPKIFGVEVTPSVTSVESSEQFWRKIPQIWRIFEPCLINFNEGCYKIYVIKYIIKCGLSQGSFSLPLGQMAGKHQHTT